MTNLCSKFKCIPLIFSDFWRWTPFYLNSFSNWNFTGKIVLIFFTMSKKCKFCPSSEVPESFDIECCLNIKKVKEAWGQFAWQKLKMIMRLSLLSDNVRVRSVRRVICIRNGSMHFNRACRTFQERENWQLKSKRKQIVWRTPWVESNPLVWKLLSDIPMKFEKLKIKKK